MEEQSFRNEGIKVTGRLTITNPRTGEVLYEKDNLVVNVGLEYIADRMKDNTADALGYIAVGTGATAVSATDTSLYAEIDRKAATSTDATDNTFVIDADWTEAEAVANWKEVAIFNAASSGVMFNRINVDFDKTAADPVNVQFTITFANT